VASSYGGCDFGTNTSGPKKQAILLCAEFASKIARSNKAFFKGTVLYHLPREQLLRAAVSVLVTAFDDLVHRGEGGLFNILLASKLAGRVAYSAREAWEKKYLFESEAGVKNTTSTRPTASLPIYTPPPPNTLAQGVPHRRSIQHVPARLPEHNVSPSSQLHNLASSATNLGDTPREDDEELTDLDDDELTDLSDGEIAKLSIADARFFR
jgi:hypothetical protein